MPRAVLAGLTIILAIGGPNSEGLRARPERALRLGRE